MLSRIVSRIRPAISYQSYPRSRSTVSKPSFVDPYPLPLSEDISTPESDPNAFPLRKLRDNENKQTLRARLIYQSRKRGTLESDLLLSTFANDHLDSMSEEEMREFDELMDEPDWDIYYWAVGKREPPPRWAASSLLERLKKHTANEEKVARRMPDLK